MKTKTVFLVPFLVLGSLFPVPCFAEQQIKVGVITDLTGKASYLGRQTRLGLEIALEELKRKGEEIEVVLGDSSFAPPKAVSEAQKMISLDKVHALFVNFTPLGRAVSPVARKAEKLFVYTGAATSPIEDNPYAFKSYLDYVRGCEAISGHWKKLKVKTIALLRPESEFGELCEIGVRKVYKEPEVFSYNMGEEVKAQVLALKNKGVEAILNATYEGDFLNMLKALQQLRFKPLLGAEETSLGAQARRDFAQTIEGVVFYGMPAPAQTFIDKLKAKDPSNSLIGLEHAGMAYLHIHQIYKAIKACPPDDVECQVKQLQHSPSDAEFGFERWDENRVGVFNWALRVIKDGKTETLGGGDPSVLQMN